MNSIVLDLEWNQAQTRDREAPGLTFEVIEIGAVRLDEHGNQTDPGQSGRVWAGEW